VTVPAGLPAEPKRLLESVAKNAGWPKVDDAAVYL
jgi:hypothetical protein